MTTATTTTTTKTTTALDALRDNLGDRAELLNYLPHDNVEVQDQGEMPLAIPKAILVGTVPENGPAHRIPRVWVYLCRKSYTLVFHTYYPNGKPGGVLITDEVLSEMVPHEAFRFATDPIRLLVLATYYFMKIVVWPADNLALNKHQMAVLLSICEDIRGQTKESCLTKRASKVVILHVRVPEELLGPTSRYEKQTGTHSHQYRPNDSGIEDMDYERGETVDSITTDGSIFSRRQDEPQGNSTATESSVDRFLSLECQEKSLQQELEAHGRSMQRTRECMARLDEKMKQELEELDVLATRQDECSMEKNRLRDTMSKEDFREMGRRDVSNKQQKTH